jgi:hypothetical protein
MGELNLRVTGRAMAALVVQVFDATGRLVLHERANGTAMRIEASTLAPGSYRVEITDGAQRLGGGTWIKR